MSKVGGIASSSQIKPCEYNIVLVILYRTDAKRNILWAVIVTATEVLESETINFIPTKIKPKSDGTSPLAYT